MSNKFSITKEIDLERLNYNIDEHICRTGEDPYVFMNNDTLSEVINECYRFYNTSSIPVIRNKDNGKVGTYSGCKVFVNNELKFGIIELR